MNCCAGRSTMSSGSQQQYITGPTLHRRHYPSATMTEYTETGASPANVRTTVYLYRLTVSNKPHLLSNALLSRAYDSLQPLMLSTLAPESMSLYTVTHSRSSRKYSRWICTTRLLRFYRLGRSRDVTEECDPHSSIHTSSILTFFPPPSFPRPHGKESSVREKNHCNCDLFVYRPNLAWPTTPSRNALQRLRLDFPNGSSANLESA